MHLKGYGFLRIFRTGTPPGGVQYWATDDLDLTAPTCQELEEQGWGMETDHRGIKQCCGIEGAQVRQATGPKNHQVRKSYW